MGHDAHHDVIPNPDYDGPGQHCLPPPVREGIGQSIYFTLLIAALAFGAAALGVTIALS